jgi:hypothetical protein
VLKNGRRQGARTSGGISSGRKLWRILTAKSTAGSLAAVRRQYGRGQHSHRRRGEAPSSPTNSLCVRRRTLRVIMEFAGRGLGGREALRDGAVGASRVRSPLAHLAAADSGKGPGLCHHQPLVPACKRDHGASRRGVAGLVTAGSRASWTTGELARLGVGGQPRTRLFRNRPSTSETSAGKATQATAEPPSLRRSRASQSCQLIRRRRRQLP